MKNEMVCRDLGKTYSQGALEFLLSKAGGSQIELADLEAFYASSISWLTASSFCLMLEKAGPQEAYRFLTMVMAGTSACVRLKGAPFMLTMSAQLDAVEEETTDGAAAAPAPANDSCSCQLVGGECPTCPQAVKAAYYDLCTFTLSYLQDTESKARSLAQGCKVCGAKYADRMISELVKDGISKTLDQEPEALKQQAIAMALQTIVVFGISEAPLTVQALRDRQG